MLWKQWIQKNIVYAHQTSSKYQLFDSLNDHCKELIYNPTVIVWVHKLPHWKVIYDDLQNFKPQQKTKNKEMIKEQDDAYIEPWIMSSN